jgi:hypothetical protein
MATRYDKTLADYLVIAVSPALIMTLIGSLVYFLLEVFYQGSFTGRLHYILTLFIFAAVLIGRISIEDGRERATLFALPLAGATLLATTRFVQYQGSLLGSYTFIINFGLIALIWWCADRLTWDCTMIDEGETGSGEGLLDAAGLGKRPVGWDKQASASAGPPSVLPGGPALAGLAGPTLRTPRGKPHAPGVWIVYFSLAALPLFGLGQLAIPAAQESRRRYVFFLLAVYVASGLGLLLTTSFLGLRRYLRQRQLPMPVLMAGAWIGVGCVLIFTVMGLALLLPRPNAEFAASKVPFVMGSPDQKPSQQGMGDEGVKSDEPGRPMPDEKGKPVPGRDGEQSPDGKPSEKSGGDRKDNVKPDSSKQNGNKPDSNKTGGDKKQDQPESDDKAAEPRTTGAPARQQPPGEADNRSQGQGPKQDPKHQQPSDQKRDDRSPGSQKDEEKPKSGTQSQKPSHEPQARQAPEKLTPQIKPPMDLTSAFAWLLPLVQIVFYIIVAGLAAFWAWRHRAAIVAAFRDVVAGIRSLWERLFGRKGTATDAAAKGEHKRPKPRRFADFADPFATGMAAQLTSDQLVRYLFQALEAWAAEEGCPRASEQTPHEFAGSVARSKRSLRHLAAGLADLYCEAAYAPGRLSISNMEPLQDLWRALHARPAAPRDPSAASQQAVS